MAGPLFRLARAHPLSLFLLVTALLALGGLGWHLGRQWVTPDVTARPALWRISQGEHVAYLFGTVHAVPRNAAWLSPRIEEAVQASDRLVLEVTDLDEERRSRAVFERLGRSAGLPKIEARLAPADAARYRTLSGRHDAAFRDLAAYESWAAALLVNAAVSQHLALSSDNAGEAVLEDRFRRTGRSVSGLESVEGQLSLFDSLPEVDQRRLLSQSVREADAAATLYEALYSSWADGRLDQLQRQFLASLADAPTLRRTLLDERNRRWAQQITADLNRHRGTAFIAVGAGHLLGSDSLQVRLAELGWRIERIQ